jgi:rubrerythrin
MSLIRHDKRKHTTGYHAPARPLGRARRLLELYGVGKGYHCPECKTYFGYTTDAHCWVCGTPIVNPPVRASEDAGEGRA